MWAPFWLAFRSFTSNSGRSLTLLAVVLLGVAGTGGVLLTNDAMSRGIERAWRSTVGTSNLQVRSFSGGFSDATLARVRSIPDVAAVAPTARKWVFYRVPGERALGERIGIDRGFVEIIGVDPLAEPRVRGYQWRGSFVADTVPTGVVAREAWAQERGLKLGDSIDLITRGGLTEFQLVGLLSEEAGIATYGSTVLVSMQTARGAFGMEDRVGTMSVVLTSEGATAAVQAGLAREIPEGHIVRRSEDIRADLARAISELQASLLFFGATALFVAFFLIVNTMEMTVVDQLDQTGRLRAAGASRELIFGYILLQGLIPGVVGSILGALVAYGLAAGLASWIASTQEVAVAPVLFSAPITLLSALVGMAAVVAAAVSPSLRAARVSPIEMLQVGEAEGGRVGWLALALGIVLVAGSLRVIFVPLPGASGRFLQAGALLPLLAGMVLVSRLVVGPLNRVVAILFAVLGGPPERLAARNLARHGGRTSLTVAGFMVSLSLLVALASVAMSSLRAGERWTRSLVPAELVVVSPVDQAPPFVGEFAKIPGVGQASPVAFWLSQSTGWLVQMASVDPALFVPGLEFVEGAPQEARALMERGGAVLVPRRLARERGLKLGDMLPLQTAGGVQPLRIAGVIAHSFPSPDGARTVLVSQDDAARLFDRRAFRLIMLKADGTRAPALLRADVADAAELYGMSATSAEQIAAQVALAVWNLVALLGALVAIGLIFGAFGTANTMLMNVMERSRELSVLWAAGMSRWQLQLMTVAEASMMGFVGGVLGVALGAILSWILVGFWRTSGFEPEYVFPWQVAGAGVLLTVFASVVAAIGPARRSGRAVAQ